MGWYQSGQTGRTVNPLALPTGVRIPPGPPIIFSTKNPYFGFFVWSHRLVVRTLDSHSGNRGSIPLGTTNDTLS
jgi:hypothetical protein